MGLQVPQKFTYQRDYSAWNGDHNPETGGRRGTEITDLDPQTAAGVWGILNLFWDGPTDKALDWDTGDLGSFFMEHLDRSGAEQAPNLKAYTLREENKQTERDG